MWHVGDLLLCVVDGFDNGCRQLFERICQRILFWSCFTVRGTGFGVGGDTSIRVKAADGAIAFLQYAATFFNQRLDVLNKLLFVEFVLWSSVCNFDALSSR